MSRINFGRVAIGGLLASNIFPRAMMVMVTVWGLIELTVAGIAGAAVYQEA